ncbi:MAG: Rpn family recombination-promoting nuclease/putative transposase [Magnetococcales bacterium]|nr:Rpn family recombination-promoting nuclease/putative transposase [Magnetococcales bacterium]
MEDKGQGFRYSIAMLDLAQPHDRLFKALLSHPETAGALLREHLPPAIVALLANEPPEPVEGTLSTWVRSRTAGFPVMRGCGPDSWR